MPVGRLEADPIHGLVVILVFGTRDHLVTFPFYLCISTLSLDFVSHGDDHEDQTEYPHRFFEQS